jgi:rhodanese-related sulfurtransferase
MPKTVTTTAARALRSAGVRFVDVLPPTAFAEERIAGAVNVPLAEINEAPARFDLDEPIVVYCFDHQ